MNQTHLVRVKGLSGGSWRSEPVEQLQPIKARKIADVACHKHQALGCSNRGDLTISKGRPLESRFCK